MPKQKFEQAKKFCQGEYQGDENALWEVMGDTAAATVTLDSDTANKLSIKVLQKYLGILGNGAVSYQQDGTEKYLTPELNMLDKEMKKIFELISLMTAERLRILIFLALWYLLRIKIPYTKTL